MKTKTILRATLIALIGLGLLLPWVASAELTLKLPAIFSEQMVLQSDKPAPIWGQAKPGAKVVVTLGEISAEGTTDDHGNWRVELPAGPAGGPWDLVVEADSVKLEIKEVLRGEVWLCSGQSNMAMAFHALPNYAAMVVQANDPQLRYFRPQRVQASAEKLTELPGKWSDVTPKSMHSFSAVPYFFGQKIREATGKPVGLIISAVGGSPIESWTDLATMQGNPSFEASLGRFAQAKAEFPVRLKEFEEELAGWDLQARAAEAKGEPRPRKPRMPLGDNHPNAPANLYNGMIHPLVGYAVRGMLWYQGEANCGIDAAIYAEQFPAMIQNWRQAWTDPELPFYFVQLPNYRVGLRALAVLRESQRQALQLPHTGMAVTIDVGDVAQLHPENKLDVGERLARWALKNEYGENIVPSGPLVRQAELQNGKVIVHFDYAVGLKTSNGEAPQTFEAAGPDGTFVPVCATVQGETIVIQPPGAEAIQTIRYGWDSSPPVNLVNSENLPASPFVIDAFSITALAGELWLPAVLSDHAVLQRGPATPVWGKAAPGAEVVVAVGDLRTTTTADGQGTWKVELDLTGTGPGPFRMAVRSGSKEVILDDVVVGEVWLASGQSNMVRTLGRTLGADEEIPKSANTMLRRFSVSYAHADQPMQDMQGQWMVASPETSGGFSAVAYHFGKTIQEALGVPVGIIISAAGSSVAETWTSRESLDTVPELAAAAERVRQQTADYPGAREAYQRALHEWLKQTGRTDRREVMPERLLNDESVVWETVKIPHTPSDRAQPGAVWLRTAVEIPAEQAGLTTFLQLGTVHGFDEIYWNGQKISATATDEALPMIRRDSVMRVPREVVREGANDLAIRLYFPNATPFLEVTRDQLRLRNGIPLAGEWRQHREFTLPALNESEVAAEPLRLRPPPSPAKSYSQLFNAMIHPLLPYALAGVIWYQGESNTSRAAAYRTAFPLLINDWRKLWNRDDLPFYWVQIAPHFAKLSEPQSNSTWAALREAQTMTLALPFTGQAVTLDLGEAEDIHPTEKAPVGRRLAAIALAKTYGHAVSFQGPVFESARFVDGEAVVSFSDTAGGLSAKQLPEKHALSKIPPRYEPLGRNSPDSELEGFELAGEDGVLHWADAWINGSQVVVSSSAVSSPRAVRYAWADNPTGNLWGKNGFPAGPFRAEAPSDTASGAISLP